MLYGRLEKMRRCSAFIGFVIVTSLCTCATANAATASDLDPASPRVRALAAEQDKVVSSPSVSVQQYATLEVQKKAIEDAQKSFENFGFGIALGYRHLKDCSNCVRSAEVVNGIVRVTEEDKDSISFMLETHYYLLLDKEKMKGLGPFVVVDPGSDSSPLKGYGIGVMFGARSSEASSRSFNLGIAYYVDTKTKVLGDGIEANQPLPTGESGVRYKNISKKGYAIVLSYAF